MIKSKPLRYLLLVLLGLSSITVNRIFVNQVQEEHNPQKAASEKEELLVIRVIDGDTIELETGEKVRYIGINAPEFNQNNSRTEECFAREAKEENEKLVLGKTVRLEKDVSQTDKYGRLLRYVWQENSLINLELVRRGFAQSSTYPPDVKYQDSFLEAEKYARENNLGLWQKCR